MVDVRADTLGVVNTGAASVAPRIESVQDESTAVTVDIDDAVRAEHGNIEHRGAGDGRSPGDACRYVLGFEFTSIRREELRKIRIRLARLGQASVVPDRQGQSRRTSGVRLRQMSRHLPRQKGDDLEIAGMREQGVRVSGA
jgi:hypothetical protein